MKITRTYGLYKYTVEMEPKVSKQLDMEHLGVDIFWEYNIKLIDHPGGLTNDMIRGILNFIGDMEKEYINAQMKGALTDLLPNKNSLSDHWTPTPYTDPAKDPYSPYGKLIFSADKSEYPQFSSDTK